MPFTRYSRSIAVFDQGICSLSNFVTVVLAAKLMLPIDFGMFTMLFTGLMVVAGVQNSLVLSPIRVYGVNNILGLGYFGNQLVIQFFFSLCLSLCLLLFLGVIAGLPWHLAILYVACMLSIQLHDFLRTVGINQLNMYNVLVLDICVHGIRLSLLSVLYYFDVTQPIFVYLVLFVAPIATLPSLVRLLAVKKNILDIQRLFLQNWAFGRWILLESLFFTLSTHFYVYLAALILGVDVAGGINSAVTIVNVINIIVMGYSNYAAAIARGILLKDGESVWRTYVLKATLTIFVISVFFLMGVFFFREFLLAEIFGETYRPYASLIPVLALAYLCVPINSMLIVAFRSRERPQIGLTAKIISSLLTLVFSYALISKYAELGVVFGMLITQVSWLTVYIYFAYRCGLLKANNHQTNREFGDPGDANPKTSMLTRCQGKKTHASPDIS